MADDLMADAHVDPRRLAGALAATTTAAAAAM